MPILPHSWYHTCLGLDTEKGLMRIVVNGYLVVDRIEAYFENSKDIRPMNLSERITLFKAAYVGHWSQSRGVYSNLNVFDYMMDIDEMKDVTSGEKCGIPGNYLSWEQMEWKVFGQIKEEYVKLEDLCRKKTDE